MKFSKIILIAALAALAEPVQSVALDRKKKKDDPLPTAADTPSSGYFGADEDDVMNNIF